MPTKTVYLAQGFERKGKGFRPGTPFPFKTADEARRRAERGRDNFNGRLVGFIALQMDVDEESGDPQGEPVLLAKFGELPREFSDD
ncbi:hypothetical protein [Antarcticirhabdus aurantiaca]|uniref:Uncharacterized protein n=1 Tax=Antarcticirhabdus aurantiaca TaxID=2606717 RepID=A0ACD4NJ38_9HYPH|nr:hypothetical protein [Antarcticirhabdus aurantiaca]WAJ26898.1 hypothetical protein OXU80_18800 [Jeongeuplla avenae]